MFPPFPLRAGKIARLPHEERKGEVMSHRNRWAAALVAVGTVVAGEAGASWWRVLEEDFSSDPSNRWTYAGVTNGVGDPLFQYDTVNQRLAAEWSQDNHYDGSGDPQVILNSRFSRPLDRVLTERDTFRFGATLRVTSGSIPDTLEFYQIASFGLYNLEAAIRGEDRAQSDNFSGNVELVRDANSLVEFNYFINNESFGFNPFVQGVLVTELPPGEVDATAHYVTGTGSDPLFHDTDMGPDTYLPEDTNLYVEVVFHGATTGDVARRVYCGIYTEPARTNLLNVNGVPMFYWTQPMPAGRVFRLSEAAFVNWAAINFTVLFGGSTPGGAGLGAFDDLYVDLAVSPGRTVAVARESDGTRITFAAEAGRTYAVLNRTNLVAGGWSTSGVVTATSDFVLWTNPAPASIDVWTIEEMEGPTS